MRILIASAIIAALLLPFLAEAVFAERNITINKYRQTPRQIQRLDKWACSRVPDGNYWLNFKTGVWGYWGNHRAMGKIGANCRRARQQPVPDYPGFIRRTPGGSIISDGKCTFVAGVPVGNCN